MRDAAAEGPFGGLIASGWHTSAIAMRLVTDAALAGSESFASPGLQYLKWPNPVRPGDSLRLVADVVEVRRSEKRPTLGILRWRWRLFNQTRTAGAGPGGDQPVQAEPLSGLRPTAPRKTLRQRLRGAFR